MSNSLCLHRGATVVERGQLDAVQTPNPTKSWYPIPHQTLLDEVETAIRANNLTIVNEQHALARDGQRYFGILQVTNGHNADDFGLIMGLRNSHDQSFPAGLALGARVFVCDNLSFSSEVSLARKHTRFIQRDLPQVVAKGVGRLTQLRHSQETRFNAYKARPMEDREAHDLVIRAIDTQVIPVTYVPEVLREWRKPSFPEFQQRTAWSLFNAFTFSMRNNLTLLPQRSQALHGLMDLTCGIILSSDSKYTMSA